MSVKHDSFTVSREIAACRAHVWACWADPAMKRKWFVDHDGPEWETLHYSLDFRVGGVERGAWRMQATDQTPMAGEHANETVYLAIQPETRIVYAYTMAMNGSVHSASLASVRLEDTDGGGTRLTYTETLDALGETDGIAGRQNGWGWLMDQLESVLKETADG